MSTLALQISLRCGACGVVVPVNGLVNEVTCWSCEKHTPLDSTIWGMIFEQPLAEAKTLSPQVQRAGTLTTDIGTIHRVYHTGAPHCGACQAALDASVFASAVGHAPSVPCPSCRQGVAVRAAPPELAAKGVVGIAAETEGVKKKREPVPLACTSCGGALNVDGSTKLVTCPFCNNQQYLPNELLLALRATPVRPWSLLMQDGAVAAPEKTQASWQTVTDVIVDANGNLYLWGLSLDPSASKPRAKTPEEKRAMLAAMLGGLDAGGGGDVNSGESLFCMAPDLTLKWKLDGLPFGAGTKLAFARSGHLIVRNGDHAEVRRCDTGALVLRFSGNQGEGGRLGLNFMSQLVVDADGTLVAYTYDDELLRRFDATGHPIAMWGVGPPRDHSREVADDPWGPFVFQLKNQPSRVHSVLLAVGWDGGLYLQSSLKMEGASHLAAFDRSGKHLYTAQIPVQAPGFEARPTIDGYGRAYVLLPNDGGTVYRVEGWGRNVVPFARTPSSGADLLGGGTFMACTPDGSLYLVSGAGVLRRLAPDGRVAFLSPGAIAADQRRGDVF